MGKKVVLIKMITAADCDKCRDVYNRIINAAKNTNVLIDIQSFDFSNPEAVTLGVEYGLDDIPSFIINGHVFCGVNFSDAAVEQIMRKA